ncbi:MAG TPA: gliding motility-associated C-terminal domain-containing protein [Puia sp.]
MKPFLSALLFISCVLQKAAGQPFISRWQYEWGGAKTDIVANMIPLPGNQYLFGASSGSDPSCTKTSLCYGGSDFALFVLDDNGNKLWEKTYGGAADDVLNDVEKASSGGFIMTGYTYSGPSGIKTSSNYGDADIWVVRVDDNGNLLWEKDFGGLNYDKAVKVLNTPDGGFLVGCTSYSNYSGWDYTTGDYLLLKLDANGNLQWQKDYGGTREDELQDMLTMPDGNYLISGVSGSPISGTKTAPPLGGLDNWIICIKPNGDIVWDKAYGTSLDDYGGATLLALQDGNYLLTGSTSTSSDFIWKIDPQGNIIWGQTCMGYGIFVKSIQDANGDIYVGGYSGADYEGCKTSPQVGGSGDIWIAVYDAAGNKIDDMDYGGDNIEYLTDLKIVNGDLWLVGWTSSFRNGNKTVDRCGTSDQTWDAWIIRLSHSLYIHDPTASELCSNTTSFDVYFTANNVYPPGNIFTAQLSDADGSFALPTDIGALASTGSGTISVNLPAGLPPSDTYEIRVVSSLTTDISAGYSLSLHGSPHASLGKDTTICDNLPLTITPGVQPPGTQFLWSDGSMGSTLIVSSAREYSCDVQNSCGVAHASINITTNSLPVADIGSDRHVCHGSTITLQSAVQSVDVSYLWSSGASTPSITVQTGGNYWLHATNGCGTTGDTILVTVDPRPISKLDKDSILCSGTSRTLDAGPGYADYLWNNLQRGETRTVNTLGQYSVRITAANGCTTQDTVTISRIATTPAAFLPGDTGICSYEEITLTSSLDFRQYAWSTGESTPSIHITSPGKYWLEGTDDDGCTGTDSILVAAKQCPYGFFMPAAFTPNQDGHNDLCRPMIFGKVNKFRFLIFDRWGNKVFETSDPGRGWDGIVGGHPADAGVFVWFCTYQLADAPEQHKKGTVLLVR